MEPNVSQDKPAQALNLVTISQTHLTQSAQIVLMDV